MKNFQVYVNNFDENLDGVDYIEYDTIEEVLDYHEDDDNTQICIEYEDGKIEIIKDIKSNKEIK